MRLDRIDVDMVAAQVERMQTAEYRREVTERNSPSGGKRSEKAYAAWSIRGVLTPAGRVFDFARRRMEWAGTNPVRDLDRGERPKLAQRERRILSHDELAAVLAAADEPYRTVLVTAAGLGTRLGETLGLVWGDVDLERGTVAIRYQADRQGRRVELKTARSRRVIEMPGSVVSALRAHKLRSRPAGDDGLIFCTRTGAPLDQRNVARRGLAKAYKRAKLRGRAPTFHELRHAHASAWIAGGGDLVELSNRLGHRDPAVTASIYSHEFEAAARSADRRARLDRLYGADDGSSVAAAGVSSAAAEPPAPEAEVVDLRARRGARQ